MQRLLRTVVGVALLAAAGCGSAQPAGQSGVRVSALAEPKAGYVQPPAGTPGYSVAPEGAEDDATARRDPFRILDYHNLDDIVVYLVPEGGSAAAAAPVPAPVVVDAGPAAARPGLLVSAVGGELRVRNTSAAPQVVYLRGEGGALSDVGTLAPGATVPVPLAAAGPIGVFRETNGPDDQCVADLYVAPNGWVAKAVGGAKVTFAPVPPGRYTLATWHPRLPGTRQSVDLAAGRYTDATATVSVNPLPKVAAAPR